MTEELVLECRALALESYIHNCCRHKTLLKDALLCGQALLRGASIQVERHRRISHWRRKYDKK